jgi:putative peptidoglycan lipid II flippase
MRDARTPTLVNICMVLAKIILVLLAREVLSGDAQVIALNVSTSLSYIVGAVLGHVLLTRRFGRLGFLAVVRTVGRIAIAAAIAGVIAWGGVYVAHLIAGSGRVGSFVALILGGIPAIVVFVIVGRALHISELSDILGALRRRPAAAPPERQSATSERESQGP